MKTKLLSLFQKWANWKNILALFALQMLFNLVIMPSASSSDTHDIPILDLQFFYTPQRAYEIISAYTPELRQAAAMTRLTLDIIYPIVYGLMLCLLLVVTFRKAFPKSRFADTSVFVPWIGVLFDYLENFGLATMYLSYPTEFYFLARLTSIFTTLKWTFIGIGFLLALIGAVKLVFVKKKKE
ncbi:MAG: hypothetical protein GY755_01070 [Chloroflexi bacterium]|nr:hypothetical protein [Chloroflexota bacterium]